MNIEAFKSIMRPLARQTNLRFPSEDHVNDWYAVLRDLPERALAQAVAVYLMEGDAWPTPAKIRRLAIEQTHGVAPDAGAAWANVVQAMRGIHQRPDGWWEPGDMSILTPMEREAVRRMGGLRVMMDCEELTALRAQFRRVWEALAASEQRLTALPETVRPKEIGFDRETAGLVRRLAESMDPKRLETQQ